MRLLLLLPLAAALASGCLKPAPVTTAPTAADEVGHDHGHEHTKDKMALAHAGKRHAWLTAHLAKAGNELDVFFETDHGALARPFAVPVPKFTATATRVGDDKTFTLIFEPAPGEERPVDEPPGMYSHFVAAAWWMMPDDVLTVTADVEVDGLVRQPEWKNFVPRTYAHHIEE